MINPQSTTLMQAYDPYITQERLIFFHAGNDKPLKEYPSADDPRWVHAFSFDHENTHCMVIIKEFMTLNDARLWLIMFLEHQKQVFKIGGFTDQLTEAQYQNIIGGITFNDYDWLEPL